MTTSSHLYPLCQIPPQNKTAGGSRYIGSKKFFPALKGMALYRLILNKNGIREPHWHSNADEMGYCLKGQVLVTIYANGNHKETFVVNVGEVFLVPSGVLHHIENVADGESEIILQFSHEEPEDFGISSALGFLSNAVLGNTWGVNQDIFKPLKRSTTPVFASLSETRASIPEDALYTSLYKYNLEGSQPILSKEGGAVKVARNNTWPMTTTHALYSLTLNQVGMREPHWHPETAELGYVTHGKGRMSILSADGTVDTYEMIPGDMYFIPKAYPHHIENLRSDQELKILIFFDQGMPGDIGFSGSVRAYSNEVLGSVMDMEPVFFDKLHKYYSDLLIVTKVNTLDKG